MHACMHVLYGVNNERYWFHETDEFTVNVEPRPRDCLKVRCEE